jgi:hypothetical protein
MIQDGSTPPAYRPVRLTGEPTLAVALLSSGQPAQLTALLRSLAPDCARRDVLLVAACRAGTADPHRWEKAFPGVRFIWGEGLPEAELRTRALAAVDGDIVVFVDEDQAGEAGWLETRLAGWPGAPRPDRGRPRRRGMSLSRQTMSAAPINNQNNGLA